MAVLAGFVKVKAGMLPYSETNAQELQSSPGVGNPSKRGRMFTLAHFSDPHIGPLPKARIRELAGKRVLGWINWNRGRNATHRMEVLGALLADMREQNPDHIALTGDVVNLGLPAEYPAARTFLETVGAPDHLSLVPGNHDVYTRNSAARLLHAFDPWMRGDHASEDAVNEAERFPYVRRRGRVALIGLSSAIPTGPFMATGKVGVLQMKRLKTVLAGLKQEGMCRIVMIHHPIRRQDAAPTAMLLDADRLQKVLLETGAEAVLHGHIHNGRIHHVRGPEGRIPALCVPSASATPDRSRWPAAYNLLRISPQEQGWSIELTVRGLATLDEPPRVLRRERLC